MEGKFMDNLFSNPGEKIKDIAQWAFVIECALALIGVFVLMDDGMEPILAILSLFLAAGAAYYSNLLLYGFGELVESTTYAKKTSEQLATDSSETMKEIDELPEI